MGVIQYLKDKITGLRYAKMLNSGAPIFSQFGDNVYASDIVQSAVDCIVQEMTKVNPCHVLRRGYDREAVNDSIQHVLNNPNELMTKSDFMSKIVWNLILNCNSIIYPVYEEITDSKGNKSKRYIALYPLQPREVKFLEDEAGTLFIRMKFKNGSEWDLPYEEVIHIRYKFSFNDFMGGNAKGQPDNEALLKLLQMNHSMLEGTLKAMKASFATTGFLKSGAYMDKERVEKMVEEFNEQLKKDGSTIMGIDAKSDYIPVTKKVQIVDPELIKFIDTRILRNTGVSMAILSGDYTKEQYEAFYQKKLEPIIIAISQAFTKCLFTDRMKQLGHEILYLPRELIFLNTSQVIEAIRIMGDRGSIYENEIRIAFGFVPDPALNGVRMMSLNYVNVEYAKDYQLKGIGTKGEKNE